MKPIVTTGLAAALLALSLTANAQLVFDFTFDNSNDGTVTAPIVGTGTVTLASDPGDGDFTFASVSPTFAFTFGAENFTNTDLATPPGNIVLRITNDGTNRFLNFGGTTGGPFGGSIDFVNSTPMGLSFQPGFGPLYFLTGTFFGTYQGIVTTAVPEPGTVALSLGLVALGGLTFRRARRK